MTTARLAITLARTLADLGGTVLNYVPVTDFTRRDGRIAGVIARDAETGEELAIEARAVINATGVYVDAVRRLDDAGAPPLLTLSQGAHLVLDRSFMPGSTALLVPRTDDGRVLFAIPWHDHVLVGTTDTPTNDLAIEPRPLHEEVAYLIEYVDRYLDRRPRPTEILSTFAGLRPLLRGQIGSRTSKLSREHAVVVSESGLVTVTGGKWTTYRRMAIDAVDHACTRGQPCRQAIANRRAQAARLARGRLPRRRSSLGLRLGHSAAGMLSALITPSGTNRCIRRLPYRASEVVWAARHEAARSVQDVLARRTRALFLDARASIEAAAQVAKLLAAELGRDKSWEEQQVAEFRTLAAGYLPTA